MFFSLIIHKEHCDDLYSLVRGAGLTMKTFSYDVPKSEWFHLPMFPFWNNKGISSSNNEKVLYSVVAYREADASQVVVLYQDNDGMRFLFSCLILALT